MTYKPAQPTEALRIRSLFRTLLGAFLLCHVAKPSGAQPTQSPKAAMQSSAQTTPGQNALSPYDVWLACRNSRIHTVTPNPDPASEDTASRMRTLCIDLKLPTSLRQLSSSEASAWKTLGNLPTVGMVKKVGEGTADATAADTKALTSDLGLLFVLGKTTLPDEVLAKVGTFAERVRLYLADHLDERLQIVGSADASGEWKGNLALARARGELVATTLGQHGVDLSRLDVLACPMLTATEHKEMTNNTKLKQCPVGIDGVSASAKLPDPQGRAVAILTTKSSRPQVFLPLSIAPTAISSTPHAAFSAFSPASLSIAVVDQVIAQVRADIEAGLLDQALNDICAREAGSLNIGYLVPTTCGLRSRSLTDNYAVGLDGVRAAVRVDLRDLPRRYSEHQLVNTGALQGVSSELLLLVFALNAFHSASEDPWALLAQFPKWQQAVTLDSSTLQSSRVGRGLTAMAGFASLYREASVEVPRRSAVDEAQSVAQSLAHALRAYVVMAADSTSKPEWKGRSGIARLSGIDAPRLYAAAVRLQEIASDLHEIRRKGAGEGPSIRLQDLGEAVLLGVQSALPQQEGDDNQLQFLKTIVEVAAAIDNSAIHGHAREMLFQFIELAETLSRRTIDSSTTVKLSLSGPQRRVLSFVVDLGEAQSGEAVTAAVHTFIEKGSGYQSKRLAVQAGKGRKYFTINAYLGAAPVSYERPVKSTGKVRYGAALYLPVGIELGMRPKADSAIGRLGTSRGWFLQLVDLGGLGAARLTSDSARTAEASAQQLLSPGIFHVRSVGKYPFSYGVGVAYARDVQRVNDERLSAFRLSGFAAFDVPLFP